MTGLKRILTVFAALCSVAGPLHAQDDAEGSADHPLLSRYPGFYIDGFSRADYDLGQMIGSTMDDGKFALFDVIGQMSNIEYRMNTEDISTFQIISNYKAALEELGAEFLVFCVTDEQCGGKSNDFTNRGAQHPTLFGGDRIDFGRKFGLITAKVEQDGLTSYVMIVAANNGSSRKIFQSIFTDGELETGNIGIGTIEDVTAKIAETGTVVLEGVLFDFDTANLTETSSEALNVVTSYLNANPDQSFFVVGHTDGVGSYDYNFTLSQQRAGSVLDALVAGGVPVDRLTSVGVGPVAPVANNETDEGQALNRRVELVLRP